MVVGLAVARDGLFDKLARVTDGAEQRYDGNQAPDAVSDCVGNSFVFSFYLATVLMRLDLTRRARASVRRTAQVSRERENVLGAGMEAFLRGRN